MLQDVAASLVAKHLKLHPALMTLENSLTMLQTYLNAYSRSHSQTSVADSVVKDNSFLMPRTIESTWTLHLKVVKVALKDLLDL